MGNITGNPWANPWVGGPRKLSGEASGVSGWDFLDGVLNTWSKVEYVKTQRDLAKAGARQVAQRTTVERDSQPGREPLPADVASRVVSGEMAGGSNNLLPLVIGGLVLAALVS